MKKPKVTQKLILFLIKDDLTNTKLVIGLRDLGLHPDEYTLHLSETIFALMGLENSAENDAVFDHYFRLSAQVRHIDSADFPARLEKLAQALYAYLETVK